MKPLKLSSEAESAVSQLRVSNPDLYDRVNDVLDLIEDDPGNVRVRRRRYQRPAVWGVLVRHHDEDWLILWSELVECLAVHHIGPDL